MKETIASNDSAVEQEIQRDYRWDFVVNTFYGTSFAFGMSFPSSTIIRSSFVMPTYAWGRFTSFANYQMKVKA